MEELFPKDPQPPFLRGTILLAQRQPVEARKAFEKSLEISQGYLPAAERLVDLDLADKQYPRRPQSRAEVYRQRPEASASLGPPWQDLPSATGF